jgi:O-antigen/teichoic acid export membrane protein
MHFTTPPDRQPPKRTLRERLLGAARWTVLGHFGAQLLRFGSNLILTRLLAPDLFGVMSVGYTVFTGLSMISDLGLGAVVSRSRRGDDPTFLNVVWVTQIGRGVLMTFGALGLSAALWLGAGAAMFPVHSVYADPRLPELLALISLYGIASGLESTKSLWVRRNLSLATLTKIDLVAQVGTTAIILLWAWIHPSIWALGGGWVIGVALRTALTHWKLPGPRNRFDWERAAFVEILDFGKWALVSSPISFLLSSGDRILLGALLDANDMGYYAIAFLLITALQAVVLKVVGQSVLPALGEVVRDKPDKLKSTLYRIRLPLDVACLASAGALFVLGRSIVNLLYDPRYAPAGWMLSLIALTLATTSLNVFDQCLIALGRIKLLSGLNAIRLVVLWALIPLGYHFLGVRGAVAAVPLAGFVNAVVLLAIQRRLGLIDLKREAMALPWFAAGLLSGWLVDLILRI